MNDSLAKTLRGAPNRRVYRELPAYPAFVLNPWSWFSDVGLVMPRDFYPRREADILGWTSNFRAKIAGGLGLALGLSPAQIEAYEHVQADFAEMYQAAQAPTQRTPSVMQAKQTARIALEAASRQLAAIIGAQQSLNSQMRCSLGLASQRRGGYRRALPPPDHSPRLRVRTVDGRIATIELIDRASGEASRRRKPRGAFSAVVWSYAGGSGGAGGPPANIREWKYAGQTTRTISRMAFDAKLEPGAKVWLTACWVNSRGKQGPLCEPVLTHVGGAAGPVMPEMLKSARMLFVPALAPRLLNAA